VVENFIELPAFIRQCGGCRADYFNAGAFQNCESFSGMFWIWISRTGDDPLDSGGDDCGGAGRR